MKKHNQDLEIDEDLALEHKTWTVQRIGWVIMFLIIVAALFGFTGRGGMAGINEIRESTTSETMELQYDRFLRNQVSGELKVNLKGLRTTSPTVYFSKDFYEKVRVEQVVPEPENVQVSAAGITYTFSTSQPESRIIFYIKPTKVGQLHISARGPDNEIASISQFVYP